MKNNRGSYTFWALAGAYLVYLAYQLCSGYFKGESGIQFLLIGILFGIAGLWIVVQGYRGYRTAADEQKKEAASEPAEEAAGEPAEEAASEPAKEAVDEAVEESAGETADDTGGEPADVEQIKE